MSTTLVSNKNLTDLGYIFIAHAFDQVSNCVKKIDVLLIS